MSARLSLDNPQNQTVLREALDASDDRLAVAMMLRTLGCVEPHVKYMCGPVAAQTVQQAQHLPRWLLRAIAFDRLNLIFDEVAAGIHGQYATPLEVLAYLHPQPEPDEARDNIWRELYTHLAGVVQAGWDRGSRLENFGLPDLTGLSPLQQEDYQGLAGMVRFQVVKGARDIHGPGAYRRLPAGPSDNGQTTFESIFRRDNSADDSYVWELPHEQILQL